MSKPDLAQSMGIPDVSVFGTTTSPSHGMEPNLSETSPAPLHFLTPLGNSEKSTLAQAVSRAGGEPLPSREIGQFAAAAAEFLRSLHVRGKLLPLLREESVERSLLRRTEEYGLAVSNSELQSAADALRIRNSLTSSAETKRWLESERLTVAQFEDALKRSLLLERLSEHVTRGQITQHFEANLAKYDSAHLRFALVESEGQAHKLKAEVQQQGRDFAQIAQVHSIDNLSTARGGDLERVFRYEMPAVVADAVFNAQPKHVVGPIPDQQGFKLFLVEGTQPAQLDEATVNKIRKDLFTKWIAENTSNEEIDSTLTLLI